MKVVLHSPQELNFASHVQHLMHDQFEGLKLVLEKNLSYSCITTMVKVESVFDTGQKPAVEMERIMNSLTFSGKQQDVFAKHRDGMCG